MKIKTITVLLATTFLSVTAQADPIVYENGGADIANNGWNYGAISDPRPENSDFWAFYGYAGDLVTLTVYRISQALDPALYLYEGLIADDSSMPAYIASADDELPPQNYGGGGPYGDPQLSNFLLTTEGWYTVEVWDFLSSTGGGQNGLSYQINARVPEPGTLALLGLGLIGAGLARRRSV